MLIETTVLDFKLSNTFAEYEAHMNAPEQLAMFKEMGVKIFYIGKSFEEAFQKGLRMINGKGFEIYGDTISVQDIKQELKYPTDDRVRVLAHALMGTQEVRMSISEIHELTKIDNWFLMKLFNISCLSNHVFIYVLTN